MLLDETRELEMQIDTKVKIKFDWSHYSVQDSPLAVDVG